MRKGRKIVKHCVFPRICGSGGSIRRLAKAAGAVPAGQMRHLPFRALSKLGCRKSAVVVVRSAFPNQHVQNTPALEHFSYLRCRKNARRHGAKHSSKSKCAKHRTLGPLLDVQMPFCVAGAMDRAPSQK